MSAAAPETVEEAMSAYDLKTERGVQNVLYMNLSRMSHRLIVPNCHPFGWESDLVSATRKGLVVEYEVKLTRPNFKADLRKYRHRRLMDVQGMLKNGFPLPNRFVYVVPAGLVRADELPHYAGLMEVSEAGSPYGMLSTVRRPPLLHDNPIAEKPRQQLERGLVFRYWRERMKWRGAPQAGADA